MKVEKNSAIIDELKDAGHQRAERRTSSYSLYLQWSRLVANSLAPTAFLQEEFWRASYTLNWQPNRTNTTHYICSFAVEGWTCLYANSSAAAFWPSGASNRSRPCASKLWLLQHHGFKWGLCVFDSYPLTPSPVAMGTTGGGFWWRKLFRSCQHSEKSSFAPIFFAK